VIQTCLLLKFVFVNWLEARTLGRRAIMRAISNMHQVCHTQFNKTNTKIRKVVSQI